MSNDNTAVMKATDALYATYEAIVPVLRADTNITDVHKARQDFMTAMRFLTIHICNADGEVSLDESSVINDIFWLDQLGWDNEKISDLTLHQPDTIEKSIVYLESLTVLARDHGDHLDPPQSPDHNIILDTAELVFQTSLAADISSDTEAEALSEITGRLRKAAFPKVSGSLASSGSAEAAGSDQSVTQILAELNQLVGLENIKKQVETLTNLARMFAIRREMKLPAVDMSFHLAFLGNPGTGKTTVARIVAQLYGKLGLLSKGQLVEVDRSGLVADYIGQTATKVAAVVQQALGGVLFIDEAYALAEGAGSDFGHEAVTTLVKAMEDHRSDLVVIAAGYTDEMHKFLDMNPGLRSRMCRELVFDDYTPTEMVAIFRGMAGQHQYTLLTTCDAMLEQIFKLRWDERAKDFANARDVRNLFERVVDAQANRLASMATPSAADVTTITVEDIKAAAAPTNATRVMA